MSGHIEIPFQTREAVVARAEAVGLPPLARSTASPIRTMLVPALRCDRCRDTFCEIGDDLCRKCRREKAVIASIRRDLQAGHWGAHVQRNAGRETGR